MAFHRGLLVALDPSLFGDLTFLAHPHLLVVQKVYQRDRIDSDMFWNKGRPERAEVSRFPAGVLHVLCHPQHRWIVRLRNRIEYRNIAGLSRNASSKAERKLSSL